MELKHFNEMEPHETELLALLAEECGETMQAIGKALRHGLHSRHPETGVPNRIAINREAGDILAALDLLKRAGVLVPALLDGHRREKLRRVRQYLHHWPTTSIFPDADLP